MVALARMPTKCHSSFRRPGAVERGAGRLVLGQEGRQVGRRRESIPSGSSSSASRGSPCRSDWRRRVRAACGTGVAGIGHAGRQPRRGGVARRLVETDAGGALRRIEGGFERRREHRLLVVGVVARPAIAEDLLADREAVRLLHAAPVIGGGRPPVIGERDGKTPAGAFDHRIGAVLDRELRLQAGGDAPGEETLLGLASAVPRARRSLRPAAASASRDRARCRAPRSAGRPGCRRDR